MSMGNSSQDVGGGAEVVDKGGDVNVQVLLEMSGIFSRLIPDIFLNIMSRVPLSSLSQCRWVCKSWFKLIKSPGFAKIQYEWAVNNNSPWVFFWRTRENVYLVDDQVFDNLEASATAHHLALEFPIYFPTFGYVNGLLCVASNPYRYNPSAIQICNPITRENVAIPQSPKYKSPGIVSFDFDPTTNEYKVIRFIHYVDDHGKYSSSEGEVYTLGSSVWRKIEDDSHIRFIRRPGIFLHGNLHWIWYVSDSLIIIAFNVSSERFDVIQPPPHMLQNDNTYKRFVVVEGHLCFLHKEHDYSYELWAMKDYGVQSSWVKQYSFDAKVRNWFWHLSLDLIKLRNGEFLLLIEDTIREIMGYFEPEMDTIRPIRIMMHNNTRLDLQSVMQIGSLFSPKDVGK